MARLPASEIRRNFAEVLNRVAYQAERVVLERRGKAVAAIVSIRDLERLEALEDREDYEAARKAERDAAARGEEPVDWKRVKRILGL
jgi:prevent-host-death family protein